MVRPMARSIFITGAAAGIGRAAALRFARGGYFVGLSDVDERGLRALADEIGSRSCSFSVADVSRRDAIERAIAEFGARTGGVMDVLFGNAGILRMGSFADIPVEEYERMVSINVLGVVYGVRASLPLLARGERPTVVTMSSASAQYGTPEMAVYSATKFFVRGLTEALELELEPKGIRVCDVAPGYVDTEMVRSQRQPATSLQKLGASLTADDVAERVWRAAHARGVHHFLQRDVSALARVSGALPGLARRIMRHYSR